MSQDKYRRQCPERSARQSELSPAGTDDRQFYDVPLRKPLYIDLDRKRFGCECGKYITPDYPNPSSTLLLAARQTSRIGH
ncbi:hypothetical protein GGP62_003227 [Salinibacter ruber]|uniref:hypothetical protein n=1 Tax=Salinibacter ruber TaxID=146919 RepID=UPI0021695FD4|nr:hypothetical protein [Salinibacter ruber]MCS3708317.1 hypothetical protein [Salinibacter ruber]